MSTDHNRIKVADLEINEPNKTLITNENGELEFSDITGGGQDLQNVLTAGSSAEVDGGLSFVNILSGVENDRIAEFFTSDGVYTSSLQVVKSGATLATNFDTGNINASFTTVNGEAMMTQSRSTYSQALNFSPSSTGNISISLPTKTEGSYTLATLDDINQDNFVRRMFVDTGDLPDSFTKQDVIDYILTFDEEDRTVEETDSKLNILITDRGNIIKIYELQNQGKGIITSIYSNNLLLITGGLDDVLNIGNETFNKATFKSSFYPSSQLEVDYHRIYATDSDPNIATGLDSSGVGSYDHNSGEVTTLNPQGIHFNDKNLLRSNPVSTGFGSTINLPITTGYGDNKTLATLDDIPSYTTPTVDQVLTAGNTTSLGYTQGTFGAGLYFKTDGDFRYYNKDSSFNSVDVHSNPSIGFVVDSGDTSYGDSLLEVARGEVNFYTAGTVNITTTGYGTASINTGLLTERRYFQFPNKNGTLATLDDIIDTGTATTITGSITESQVTNLVTDLAGKQSTLISGTNLKTINGTSLLGSGDIAISGGSSVYQIIITTATSITTATADSAGVTQNGKNVLIDNGSNVINITCNGGVTTSYGKVGTGAITFVQGFGRVLVPVNGTLVFNGIAGSTATLWSYGTTDYLAINNY